MRRRGFTLVELVLAMALALVVTVFAWRALYQLTDRETGALSRARQRSEWAMQQSLVMELLLRDVRSAAEIPPDTGTGLVLWRYVPTADGGLDLREVRWSFDDSTLVREEEGRAPQRFTSGAVLGTAASALLLEVTPMRQVLFDPVDGGP